MKTLLLSVLLLSTLPLAAQVPQALNYQGRVAVNGAAFTGTGQFRFALVNAAGTALWSSHATNTTGLAVAQGLYSVRLGDTALPNMTAVPSAVFADPDLRLRVWFDDGTNGLQQLSPDQRLAPVGYAHRAASADSIPASAIAPNSIQPSQLAHSHQTGTAAGLASIPPAGGVLNVTFAQPFETPPAVTVDGMAVPPANVTTTGFSLTVPPRDLVVDDGTPATSSVGGHRDAILVGGFPAIAYTDDTSGDLKYIRATNAEGTAWGTPLVVAVGGTATVGQYCSMTLVNNFPAIAYYDVTNMDLKYVRATDATGTAWGAPVTVASHATNDLGKYCILKYVIASVSLRRPVIVYYDATAGTIRARVGSNSDGTAWGSEQTPDPSLPGQFAGPHFDLSGTTLYYADRTNNNLMKVEMNPVLAGWETPSAIQSDFSAVWMDVFFSGTGTMVAWQDAYQTAYSKPLPSGNRSVIAGTSSSFYPGRIAAGTLPATLYRDPQGTPFFIEAGEDGGDWKEPSAFTASVSGGLTPLRLADGSVLAVYFYNGAGGGQLRVSGTRSPAAGAWSASLPAPVVAAGVLPGSITLASLAPEVFSIFGTDNYTPGADAFAVGQHTAAVGVSSWASGRDTVASGEASTAMGCITTASGYCSTAMGCITTASGYCSTVMGQGTTASGFNSTAMGYYTTANASSATAMGYYTTASGEASTAMGISTMASGDASTAMGYFTAASGDDSTAMGYNTTASGNHSTAMSYSTTASGNYSTAMGYVTTASGYSATAMGSNTTASGNDSTAIGHYSRAETYGEVSLGFFPLANAGDVGSRVFTDVLLEVGNGVSGTPSNALTIFKDGRMGLDNADTSALVTHLLTLPNIASATNGRGIANAWNTYSDSRIKTEQRPISYGLADIMRLQPRAYTQHSGCVENGTFKCADEKGGSAETIGFIAQEVEKVIPEAVQKPEDPANQLYGMDYEKLIPVLVKATQELKTENDTLKAQLAAMQQRLEKLERPVRKR